VKDLIQGNTGDLGFVGTIAVWLWLTVLFANFAEAIAEGRGKAQASALRATRTTTVARRQSLDGTLEEVPAPELQRGDVVVRKPDHARAQRGELLQNVRVLRVSNVLQDIRPAFGHMRVLIQEKRL